MKQYGIKKQILFISASCLFALSQALGMTSPYGANTSKSLALATIPFWFILCFGVLYITDCLSKKISNLGFENYRDWVSKRTFFLGFFCCAIPWLVGFFLMYPGCGTSDSMSSIEMALGLDTLTNHHPVLFTLIVSLFVNIGNSIGNVEFGIGLYSVFTLIFLSAVCAYVCYWIASRTNSRALFIIAVLFFSLNPVIGRYAITMWKDVWFSAFLIIDILILADYARTKGTWLKSRKNKVVFGFAVLLTCLLRSNAPMVIAGTALLSVMLFKVFRNRTYIATIIIPLVLSFIVTGPVYSLFNVEKAASSEALGLPIQQVARTVAYDGDFSEESREYLEKLFDFEEIKKVYNPILANPVKWASSFNTEYFDETKFEFLKVWIQSFPQNTMFYIAAWRDQTLGYWYPVDSWIVSPSGYYYDEDGPLFTSDSVRLPDEMHTTGVSLIGFQGISDELKTTQYDFIRMNALLHPLFNISSMVFFAAVVFLVLLKQKKAIACAILPLIFLWVTMLVASPTYCEFRYMFAFHLAIPILLALLFISREYKDEK